MKIDDKALQLRIRYEPHKNQRKILRGMGKRTVIAAGRRFGKSNLCGYLALKELLLPGRKIWIVSPTYDLSKKVFDYAGGWAARYFSKYVKITKSPIPEIRCSSGSIIQGRSCDNPRSLMGDELDLVIVDEAASMNPIIWEMYLQPSLMNRSGKAFFISTPKGRNWFYNMFISEDTKSFRFSSIDNPYNPEEYIEEARRILPKDIFDQEYLADFLSDAAAVFRNVEAQSTGGYNEPDPNSEYVVGVDLGKAKNFTVITIINKRTYNVDYIDRFSGIDWKLQIQRISEASVKYNDAKIVIDATGLGDPIADELSGRGHMVIPYKYTSESKNNLILKLSSFLDHKRITYPRYDILINELNSYGYTQVDGRIKYGPPFGCHDDTVDSLSLAVWDLEEEPATYEAPYEYPDVDYT